MFRNITTNNEGKQIDNFAIFATFLSKILCAGNCDKD